MRLPANWSWQHQILVAFNTLTSLPLPMRINTKTSTPAHLRTGPQETRTPHRLHHHAHVPSGIDSSPKPNHTPANQSIRESEVSTDI